MLRSPEKNKQNRKSRPDLMGGFFYTRDLDYPGRDVYRLLKPWKRDDALRPGQPSRDPSGPGKRVPERP